MTALRRLVAVAGIAAMAAWLAASILGLIASLLGRI